MISISDYTDLITAYHKTRPRFKSTIEASISPIISAGELIRSMPIEFDLDYAIGVQLDAVGERVGISRYINIPLSLPWFSFDVVGRGFDEGIIKGPYTATNGFSPLSDEDYRDLIRAKILANSWDGTVGSIKGILDTFYLSRGSDVFIQDSQDMSLMICDAGPTPGVLVLSVMNGAYIPIKPVGVRTNYVLSSVSDTPLFGFDISNDKIAGFDAGCFGVSPSYLLELM